MTGNKKMAKLDEVVQLPGFDKNIAWKKLHTRLHGKKSHKAIAWFWWAAASVIITLLAVAVFSTRAEQKINLLAVDKINIIVPQKDVETIAPIPANKSYCIAPKEIARKTVPVIFMETNNPVITPDTVVEKSIAMIPVQSPPKKIKVVHNNELSPVPVMTEQPEKNTASILKKFISPKE